MKQSRLMSLAEAITNVAVGYGVAVVTQILIFPIFGLHTSLGQNLAMGGIFTIVSLARSFLLRRVFEAMRVNCLRLSTTRANVSSQKCLSWFRKSKEVDHGTRETS